jgi:hypothetical protein
MLKRWILKIIADDISRDGVVSKSILEKINNWDYRRLLPMRKAESFESHREPASQSAK